MRITLPEDTAIDGEVYLTSGKDGYSKNLLRNKDYCS